MLVMKGFFFHSDLRVVLVVATWASLEGLTFFLLVLNDFDDSVIFKFCFEYFSKDLYMCLKNVVSKNKVNYKLMLVIHKGKDYPEIIKTNITKLFI